MIKWEHSIFVLPFAMIGAMLAAGGWPPAGKLFWIIVCMVSARSAAMAFNRWADASIDAANPRTANRAIPAGLLSRGFCRWLHAGDGSDLYLRRLPPESRYAAALAFGAGDCDGLLLHQAIYALVASFSGIGDGDCSFGGVDCGARDAGSADSAAHCGGAFLGRGLRCALCLPGLRARPQSWPEQHSGGDWDSGGLLGFECHAYGGAWLSWFCW